MNMYYPFQWTWFFLYCNLHCYLYSLIFLMPLITSLLFTLCARLIVLSSEIDLKNLDWRNVLCWILYDWCVLLL